MSTVFEHFPSNHEGYTLGCQNRQELLEFSPGSISGDNGHSHSLKGHVACCLDGRSWLQSKFVYIYFYLSDRSSIYWACLIADTHSLGRQQVCPDAIALFMHREPVLGTINGIHPNSNVGQTTQRNTPESQRSSPGLEIMSFIFHMFLILI